MHTRTHAHTHICTPSHLHTVTPSHLLAQREAQDENFRDEKGFLIDEIHKL